MDIPVDGTLASDETLMLAWAAGDLPSFEQLYARHRTRLYRYLLRQLRQPALADDVFQDVWQRVVAARSEWTPDASFATWLYRIAHNRMTDHWRARPYRPPAPSDAAALTAVHADPPGTAVPGFFLQHLGYVGLWWLFALFVVAFWVRILRDELRGDAVPLVGSAGPAGRTVDEGPG